MSNPRFKALAEAGHTDFHKIDELEFIPFNPSKNFGIRVFNRNVMQKMLPREIYQNLINAIEGREKIKPEYANTIASAMKEWAIAHGATHYSHWFQPLTGTTAEKHDAFIEWNNPDSVIEKFSGKQLLQGEPDASSFPSGGLRSTFEARGYTGWDPSSPVFVWTAGDGVTLCIPSVFFSWTGAVLDSKIPLLRSDKKINEATLRLLKITGIEADSVFSTLGCEQEYFVIDRALRNLRPDLVLLGYTIIGAPTPKGQELQDHYFGMVKDRILSFMHDFEMKALELGIPVKTRHNEVAPAQHEVAPMFEKASIAIDHNILLMEIMRQVALKHNLTCLLHEKPFAHLNGSGKHCNWSLSTDTGINLLDPTDSPENNLHFLILLTACLCAVYRHSGLLRASIGSAGNDFRLGGHEAPPAIMSVYLGLELEDLLDSIENKTLLLKSKGKEKYDFGVQIIPELSKDNTDRNRTSPFAFTGNKFEFRAVGSSDTPSMPITVLNLIVAESLNDIVDDIETVLPKKSKLQPKELLEIILPVLQKYIKQSKAVRFSGDNYSEKWVKEAEKRGLPNIKKSIYAFDYIKSKTTEKLFKGVLTKEELESRYEILAERYAFTKNIEAKVILELFNSHILPVAYHQQKLLAKGILNTEQVLGSSKILMEEKGQLKELTQLINNGIRIARELEEVRASTESLPIAKMALKQCEEVAPKAEELREVCDKLEVIIDDGTWPLPKYRELLYMV